MSKEKKGKHKARAQRHHAEGASEEALLVTLVEVAESAPNGASDEAEGAETSLPAIFTPQFEGDYRAAFDDELLDPTFLQHAFLAQLPPGALLPHSGRVRLSEEGLDFEGLAYIPFAAMRSVQAHVDRVYHRYYAGLAALGGRGSHSHILTGGEPFVLRFHDGERTRTLYALLDWPFFLALSKEKGWRKTVGGVLPAKEKK